MYYARSLFYKAIDIFQLIKINNVSEHCLRQIVNIFDTFSILTFLRIIMSSGFVTESEAAETRQRRQEEWERVRQPEDPLERPEEPYDGRSLYDRLKEQKTKKDMEFEEAHKLSMFKKLHIELMSYCKCHT